MATPYFHQSNEELHVTDASSGLIDAILDEMNVESDDSTINEDDFVSFFNRCRDYHDQLIQETKLTAARRKISNILVFLLFVADFIVCMIYGGTRDPSSLIQYMSIGLSVLLFIGIFYVFVIPIIQIKMNKNRISRKSRNSVVPIEIPPLALTRIIE